MAVPRIEISRLSAFLTLLVTIIAALIFAPMAVVSAPDLGIERALGAIVMLTVLWAAGVRPGRLMLFVPVVIAHVIILHTGGTFARTAGLGIRAAFFACAIVLIGLHILREHEVTHDTIAGAACVYALIALMWGSLYEIVAVLSPAAFEIPASWGETSSFAFQYFSFSTLTTVGYGDVHPANPTAAGLAVAEAVVGQLYVAVTIARLVALQLIQRSGKPEP